MLSCWGQVLRVVGEAQPDSLSSHQLPGNLRELLPNMVAPRLGNSQTLYQYLSESAALGHRIVFYHFLN